MSAVLAAIAAHARREPAATALRGRCGGISNASLETRVETLGRKLEELGVRVLAIAADNSPDWVIVDLAAIRARVALVPLPPFFSRDQLRHVLDDSGADALVLDAGFDPRELGLHLAFPTRVAEGLELWRLAPAARPALPVGTAKISYTSGTTGRPKGVCLSQAAMEAVAASLRAATESARIERHLCLLPLATLLENVAGVYAPLLSGAEIALPRLTDTGLASATGLDTGKLIALLDAEGPESVILLPQLLAALVAAAERGARLTPTLRFIAVGGARVPSTLLERADRLGLPVYEGYGLTESASVVALNSPEARRRGSVGRPLAHVALSIGPESQVLVAGASMSGYLEHDSGPAARGRRAARPATADEAEARTRTIDTGDVGHVDRDGFLYIDGRRKNVFITSFGRNVSPEWVEAELTGSPTIAQAAVFGEARPFNVAVLVPASPNVRHDDLERDVAAANHRLPGYAQVYRWFVAATPFSTANGLLTSNGRNRRVDIWNAYRHAIDACYDERVGNYA